MKSQDFDIQEIIEQIVQFTKDREWDQFHNGKDLALALSIEASELNEAFLWKQPEEVYVEVTKDANIMFFRKQMSNFGRIRLNAIGAGI